jgi:integrase
MGRVYQRGRTWWVQYYRHGHLFRESARSHLKSTATTLLKVREGEIATGHAPSLRVERTTFDELAALYLDDYRLNDRRSLDTAEAHVVNLTKTFRGLLACELGTVRIREHIARRRGDGRATATINRELTALKRMFSLGARAQPPVVANIPYIPLLKGEKVRKGFFEEEDYRKLMAVVRPHVRVAVAIAFWTGLRQGEILGLRWDQVDLEHGTIRLEPGTTKNNEGREAPLIPEVHGLLNEWRRMTRAEYPECPWVCHFRGKRITQFRRAWTEGTQKAGLEGRLFHDLRRSAVRNMVQAGIPDVVAMRMSGHKTRSVFDRYAIVSARDLEVARTKLTALAQDRATVRSLLGTIGPEAPVITPASTIDSDGADQYNATL